MTGIPAGLNEIGSNELPETIKKVKKVKILLTLDKINSEPAEKTLLLCKHKG